MPDFPGSFLWGASTAAHQVEGGNTANNWHRWETEPGWRSRVAEPCGIAIDHWARWPDDLALLCELGHNAHRLSIEWSRLEPEPGRFDESAFDHYRRVLERLAELGVTPFVTLFHFTVPTWFDDLGGWASDEALDHWATFVGEAGRRLGGVMPFVCTINEPQIVAMVGHVLGIHPPGHRDLDEGLAVNARLMAAHRRAVAELRRVAPRSKAGTCLQLPCIVPADPEDASHVTMADAVRRVMVDDHIADLRAGGDTGDFVGLQYYTRMRMTGALDVVTPVPDGAETTLMGWEVFPEGFGQMLRRIAEVGLPVYVTENGVATRDDRQRVRYLRTHLGELAGALRDGVDVRGYLHWTAFDNFEWAEGYRPTFGLVGIDRSDDLRRIPRPSAHAYRDVITTGELAVLDDH